MSKLNIITTQDQAAFDNLKDYLLNEHGSIDWSFVPCEDKEQNLTKMIGMVEGIHFVWMMDGKKNGTYSRKNHNINLAEVAKWFLELNNDDDMY